MATEVATIQGPDGLWRAGLLDPKEYDQPDISGTAIFTYAMAWASIRGYWLRTSIGW